MTFLIFVVYFYLQRQRADEEAKKQAEIEALQKQLQSLKDMASGKQVKSTVIYYFRFSYAYMYIIKNNFNLLL